MSESIPRSVQRRVGTPAGEAIGISNRWTGGQYCALLTAAGLVGCGIYDIACADEFDFAIAIAKGTPAEPLVEPEDLLGAPIVAVSRKARELGIRKGMSGLDAVCVLQRATGT